MKEIKTRILVIDDDLAIRDLLECYFQPRGFAMECYAEPLEALRRLEKAQETFDLVLTDLKMPHMDGLEFVFKAKKIAPKIPVLLMTAHGSIETAVKALQGGAYDFVLKPFNCAQLCSTIERGLQFSKLEKENETLRREVRSGWSFEGAVGKSAAIQEVFDLAKRVASSTANVLITGESGTGKEVIARAIHQHGNRGSAPFVAINCSAIPDNLLESELFGHAKGAFTGAIEKRVGLFEEAEGGVLFLDEIGDMNLALQSKLLRVLQERKIKRIGENQYRPINARIIAATHKDLESEIRSKAFRDDLYYRLCVIPIQIPPLRHRTEDIIPLAQHFLEKFLAQNDSKVKGFSKAALERLVRLPWRGNVRELENVIERVVVLCREDMIGIEDLPKLDSELLRCQSDELFDGLFRKEALLSLEEVSQKYVEYVLKSVDGANDKAAKILGIDRKTLYRRRLSFEKAENVSVGDCPSIAN